MPNCKDQKREYTIAELATGEVAIVGGLVATVINHKNKNIKNKNIKNKNMNDKEIYSKIEEIYNNEKGKGFITHLVRSFLPMNRSTFMMFADPKKKMRCAITGVFLISKDEIIKFNFENQEQIFKNMADRLLGKTTENAIVENFKGKLVAVQCENSDKLLSLPAVQQLSNFALNQMLNGNRHILNAVNDERKKEGGLQVNRGGYNQNRSDVKPVMVKATTKLGDFEALKGLKDKLDNGNSVTEKK